MSGPADLPNEAMEMPLLPLRDVVVFPHMVIPLFVGRPKSIKALESAMEDGKSILLVAQKSAAKDEPAVEDLYDIGCIANILQMLKLPDGTIKVLVEGVQRAHIDKVEDLRSLFVATVRPVPVVESGGHELEAMRRAIIAQFDQYVKLNKKIPPEILSSLAGIEEAGRLADTIAAHLPLKLEQKQEVLEMFEIRPNALHAVARKAIKRKTGARGLRSILEVALLDIMYDLPTLENVEKVVVDESTIEEGGKPLLIYAEQQKVSGAN